MHCNLLTYIVVDSENIQTSQYIPNQHEITSFLHGYCTTKNHVINSPHPASSEWSGQSGVPSHRNTSDRQTPLPHCNWSSSHTIGPAARNSHNIRRKIFTSSCIFDSKLDVFEGSQYFKNFIEIERSFGCPVNVSSHAKKLSADAICGTEPKSSLPRHKSLY